LPRRTGVRGVCGRGEPAPRYHGLPDMNPTTIAAHSLLALAVLSCGAAPGPPPATPQGEVAPAPPAAPTPPPDYGIQETTSLEKTSTGRTHPAESGADLARACDAGDFERCQELGTRERAGMGMPVDMELARRHYKRGCEGKNVPACSDLGMLEIEGKGGPKDEVHGAKLIEQSCTDGNVPGCVNLAHLLVEGHGLPVDPARALSLLRAACDANNAGACNDLGVVYASGMAGVTADAGRARALFERACRGGSKDGCEDLKELGK